MIEIRNSTVFNQGREIKMRRLARRVFVYLYERANQTVSREELLNVFWPEARHEENLTKTISEIRAALQNPTYIRTAPTQGYSFALDQSIYEEILNNCIFNLTPIDERIGHIESSEQLTQLWEIDKSAYQDASITLQEFLRWWEAYPFGNKVLFRNDQVVGSFGLWPLTVEQAHDFKGGLIREGDLVPNLCDVVKQNGASHWYASGIVLRPELRGAVKTNPVATLLSVGLTLWLESGHTAFPVEILSLAYSSAGQNLLSRFGFIQLRQVCSERDPYPLYSLKANSKADMLGILHRRGLL
jgi:DNA-binding winged helix-turn-helix (wHTH) protein